MIIFQWKKKKINRLLDGRIDEILEKRFNISSYNSRYQTTIFIEFRGPLHIFKEIKSVDKSIQTTGEQKIKPKSKLGEITSGNPRQKLGNQKNTIKNVQNPYNSRKNVIDLFNHS